MVAGQVGGKPAIFETPPRIRDVGLAVAVGVAYFLAARLGRAFLTGTEGISVFWLGSGIAAGALIALGDRARSAVVTGVIGASLAINLMGGTSIWSALALALCNAGEAVLAVWLIKRLSGPMFALDRLRGVAALFVAAGVAAAVAAAGAATAMTLLGPSTSPWFNIWRVWFAADALGIVAVAPLLIGFGAVVRDVPSRREFLEGTLAVVVLTGAHTSAMALFVGPWSLIAPATVLFPVLFWLGARCQPVFAAAAAFAMAVVIVWTTTHEFGRYGDVSQPAAARILAAQVAMLGTTLAALGLAALFAEGRRHEATIVASEARLRSILDAANVIAWDVDLLRNTVHPTGPVSRILGRPERSEPHDFAGFVESIHPEDRDRVMGQFSTAVSTAATYRLEFRLNSASQRWVTAEGSTERDVDGRPVRVRGVTHDITERKKTELALAEREAQPRLAGRAARVGSFAIDYATERIQTSPGYAAIHGLAEGTEELTREEWRTRVHPDDLARLDALRSQIFDERRRELNIDYRIVGADGKARWIESRGLVSYDGDGHPERLVGVHIDITERKLAEEHMRMMVAELDHRVKNVLATVSALTSRTHDASGSVANFVATLDGRIQSMAATHHLLSSQQWKGILLSELVRRELAPYAAHDNTQIDGPDITLKAEAVQAISMVFHELTTNAAKYGALSTPDGRVLVRWYLLMNGDADARLCVEWQETGGPAVRAPGRYGYGMEIIRGLLPYELDGKVDVAFAVEGVRYRVELPVTQLTNDHARATDLPRWRAEEEDA